MMPKGCCKLFKHAVLTELTSSLRLLACFKPISKMHATKFELFDSDEVSMEFKWISMFFITLFVSKSARKKETSDNIDLLNLMFFQI